MAEKNNATIAHLHKRTVPQAGLMLLLCIVPSLLSVFMLFLVAEAFAQAYPNKPIRIVTSLPGGGNDFATRLIAQGLAGPLGQQIIIENRPSGIIVVDTVAKAPPDGYTLLIYSDGLWLLPLLQKVPYDAVMDLD